MNISEYFFAAARRGASREALVVDGRSISYAELEWHTRRLQSLLVDGAQGQYIALLASRSVTAYAGILAILASGRTYVPLNPTFPPARNRYILERVKARTIVVGDECIAALASVIDVLSPESTVVALEAGSPVREIARRSGLRVLAPGGAGSGPANDPMSAGEEPAYVLFTSGSTGNPKGVAVRHRNVQSYVESLGKLYPITSDDRLSQLFDLTFDLSVHDMFVTWAAGATLVVPPPEAVWAPVQYAREHGVSVWFSVPSVVSLLEASRRIETNALPAVRLTFFCGEKLTVNAWRLWRTVAPSSRIVNLYGPTETTIAILHFEIPHDYCESEETRGTIPIGTPFPNQQAEVRREDGTPSVRGVVGELWLSGNQVALGYLSEPQLTKERFVCEDGCVSYRTGDLVRRASEDDSLIFVGRADTQVKVTGYRVELGEVEHAVMKAAGCTQAVVVLCVRDGIEELVAVLPDEQRANKSMLRRKLAELVPAYMLPRRYVFVSDFPLNVNGKIDRGILADRVRQLHDERLDGDAADSLASAHDEGSGASPS